MKRFFGAVLLSVVVLSGCLKSSDADEQTGCRYDSCAFKAPATEIAQVKSYLDSLGINAAQHCSGLFYVVDNSGTGAAPSACSFISVRYTGSLTNGNVFESVTTATQYFALGNTIPGWLNGLPLIRQGGSIRLFIPPTLAYGSTPKYDNAGNVTIPPNSILLFTVNLDGVQ